MTSKTERKKREKTRHGHGEQCGKCRKKGVEVVMVEDIGDINIDRKKIK